MFVQTFSTTGLCGARGDHWLFEDIDFSLSPGDALLVTGPNGAGKSTLLRILAGLLPAADGHAEIMPASAPDSTALHYLGHANAIKLALLVEENIGFWASLGLIGGAEKAAAIEQALNSFNLLELRDLPARFLSAGQKRRLALSRLLASPAPLWLLDEPTTALDTASTALFERAVATHRAQGGMAIVATHQPLDIPSAQQLHLGDMLSGAA